MRYHQGTYLRVSTGILCKQIWGVFSSGQSLINVFPPPHSHCARTHTHTHLSSSSADSGHCDEFSSSCESAVFDPPSLPTNPHSDHQHQVTSRLCLCIFVPAHVSLRLCNAVTVVRGTLMATFGLLTTIKFSLPLDIVYMDTYIIFMWINIICLHNVTQLLVSLNP